MKTKLKKKNPLSLLITIFILLAIPLTLLVMQQTQIFRPKAADYNDRFLSYNGRQILTGIPSATPTAAPFVCTVCKADITRDGYVNGGDMSKMASCLGKKATDLNAAGVVCMYADIDGDGNIGEIDRICIEGQFLKTCVPSPTAAPTINPMCTACAADLNKDGFVNGGDASALSVCMGKAAAARGSNGTVCANYDIDKNGFINEADLSCISTQMLKTCTR